MIARGTFDRGEVNGRKELRMNRRLCPILFTVFLFFVTGFLGETWAQKAESGKPMVLKASIQTPANMPFAQILY